MITRSLDLEKKHERYYYYFVNTFKNSVKSYKIHSKNHPTHVKGPRINQEIYLLYYIISIYDF